MINKRFDEIIKDDIYNLISEKIPEGKMLEYKEDLPGPRDQDKKEFLADISSFANSSGGYIVYGIQEERDEKGKATGIPKNANGIETNNADAAIRRMEDLVIHGIDPRISGYRVRAINGFSKGPIILWHIPKSWASPHMVTLQTTSRFYLRKNGGKYPMDLSEIRSSILSSETLPEKIRRFRDNRISKIIIDETPVPLYQYPKTVLHIIPISGLVEKKEIDMASIIEKKLRLMPIGAHGYSYRYNLDGLLTHDRHLEHPYDSYLQLFRNGTIESVNSFWIRPNGNEKYIPSRPILEELIEALTAYLDIEKKLDFEPPISIMVSFLWVKDYVIYPGSRVFGSSIAIDRDNLMLPDVIVEDYGSKKVSDILRPIFDALWQAGGYGRCYHYDESGELKN